MNTRLKQIRITPAAFMLFSIASVLSAPLAYLKTDAPVFLVLLLGVVITAIAGVAAWGLTQLTSTWKMSQLLHTIVFVAELVVIGIIRGIAFYAMAEIFHLPQPATLGFRILNSVIVTVIWLWLACAVVSGRREYLHTYNTLVNQAVFNTAQRSSGIPGKPGVELDELENIVALKANLSEIEQHLAFTGITTESLRLAATQVRGEIENTLRPMSHRLWFNATEGTPQLRAKGLITDALTPLRFTLWRVLGICIVLMFVGGLAFLPLNVNLLTIGVSSVVLCALLTADQLMTRRRPGHLAGSIAFLALTGFLTFGITYLVLQAVMPEAIHTFSAMAGVIPLAVWVVVWSDSALALVSQDRAAITAALRSPTSQNIDYERLASYLHNSLQSELTGIAYQLEQSASSLDSQDPRQSLERLGALISRSISRDFANFTETPLDRITRIQDAWSGIAEVNMSFSADIPPEDSRLVFAVQVIEEAITNSVRHGNATEIDIRVTLQEENLLIELSSNRPLQTVEQPGVGTAWIDRYTLARHQHISADGISTLRVEL